MASKLEKNVKKAIVFHALLGLLVGVFARAYFHGLQKNESYFGQHFGECTVEILSYILINYVVVMKLFGVFENKMIFF